MEKYIIIRDKVSKCKFLGALFFSLFLLQYAIKRDRLILIIFIYGEMYMIDIKLIRENPELVKQNIKNKFQDDKLELVDKILELDKKNRETSLKGDNLRASRNSLSDKIGSLMRERKKR